MNNHKTRLSDSSVYDEVCVNCGATDGRNDDRLNQPCPKPSTPPADVEGSQELLPQMDWQQVALNEGPPCFSTQLANGDRSGWYCGRAELWSGHGLLHEYVSLNDLLTRSLDASGYVRGLSDAMKAADNMRAQNEASDDPLNNNIRADEDFLVAKAIRALISQHQEGTK